jgi:nucleotide-binding universal stress UspA family protein
VVTVWRELRGDFGVPLHHIFPDLVDVERDWATEVAEAAAAEAGKAGLEAETVVRRGDPAAEICAVARKRDSRIIVIGSRGWGRIGGLIFGSVSESVLHHAPCPVLVVPDAADVMKRGAEAKESERTKEEALA